MSFPVNCIVSMTEDGGIGKDGKLPWPQLKTDMSFFRRLTTNCPIEGKQNVVIMGRKTWFSIPPQNRPLKDRINVVVSKTMDHPPSGAHFLASSVKEALELVNSPCLSRAVALVWIIGGSGIYKEAMLTPGPMRLFVTRVLHRFECDTYFPVENMSQFKLLPEHPYSQTPGVKDNGISLQFEVYEKIN
ncbi:dihydrofolate reductase [Marmot herpesvirus 1]|nr:dihydrofolate reductase [Marmot herpesvirus 1]